eukprot:gene21616-25999_t
MIAVFLPNCVGPNSETDDTHRLAYNKAFEFFQVKIDNELVEWTGPYYDTLVNVAEGGKMRWHFNNNTWPTFSTEGCTFGEIASADCVEVQDELILILQDKKTELYNDIVSHAGKSEEEVQLIARIQSLEKQLTETAEASSQKVKELQAELEARTSGSLSEALPTEQSEALPTEQNAELRAQIRRLEEVSSEDLAEYEAQEVQLTARIQSLENQLIETAEASAQELKELQAELEARTKYEAQTVARIQTMMVEEQLQSVQSAEREPDLLVELEETTKLRALVRRLETQMADMVTRDELKLEEAKVLALTLDTKDK